MTGWALSVKCWPTEREQHPVLNILEMKVLSFTLQTVRPSCGRDDEEEMTVQSPVWDFTETIVLVKYFFPKYKSFLIKYIFLKKKIVDEWNVSKNFFGNTDNVNSAMWSEKWGESIFSHVEGSKVNASN